ncbi:MAG: DNA-binding protein [Verrucomicrobia bacterium]|nr:DNA-binding protein [Verrucomicrobiota bacterium]
MGRSQTRTPCATRFSSASPRENFLSDSWQPLAGVPALSGEVLAETLDGGQAFRWHREPDGTWSGVWAHLVVGLRLDADGRIEWSAPATNAIATASALTTYLGVDRDFAALTDALPWRSDAHLARCLAEFRGLRILRQPFGETLLSFLCSATKQIVQIKQIVALLAERHGAPLLPLSTLNPLSALRSPPSTLSPPPSALRPQPLALSSPPSASLHRLPTWPELAEIPEPELRACRLGFRARYIAETARFLAARPGWLEETETLPYAAAKARLCELPGVGEKVADCVLLFGAGRMEAFPVDVWILKTLARRYGLDGWRPAQLAQFGRAHFGPLAGLAQQYLFAWERKHR